MTAPVCRITITNEQERFYHAECTCGIEIHPGVHPFSILSLAHLHFIQHPHRGWMFIDFQEVAHPAETLAMEGAPHSRACGPTIHSHGLACHPNCPTCHGKADF